MWLGRRKNAPPIYYLTDVSGVIRETLDIMPRIPSPPPVVDDTDDTEDFIALDPELALIAAAVRSKPSQSQPITELTTGGPEVVNVKVRWLPHPLDQSGKPKVWAFKMNRVRALHLYRDGPAEHVNYQCDPFRVVFDEVADLADILFNDLIICHHNNRLFPSVTPNGMKIWADVELGTFVLVAPALLIDPFAEACNIITYNYLRTQRHESPLPTTFEDETTRSPSPDPSKEDDTREMDDEASDDQFRLTLRSSGTTITLKVRPATTCGTIVNAFLRRAGLDGKLTGKSAPSLLIDGEKMNLADPISVADLEDGDCVDVVGL